MNEIIFLITVPVLPFYLDAMDINIREKEREIANTENCNYSQQTVEKF